MLFADGSSLQNPGAAAVGGSLYHISDAGVWEAALRYRQRVGICSNNAAEYLALILGLARCADLGIRGVRVYMDSLLVVSHLTTSWRIGERLIPYAKAAFLLTSECDATFQHIPRRLNAEADLLAEKAQVEGDMVWYDETILPEIPPGVDLRGRVSLDGGRMVVAGSVAAEGVLRTLGGAPAAGSGSGGLAIPLPLE